MIDNPEEFIEDGEYDDGESPPASLIQSFIDLVNIPLKKELLNKIGQEVIRGFDVDKSSRSEWEKQTKTAMDLAMQVSEEKTWPWPKSANVKYPLITTASIQFSARAYPAIISGASVVKGEVTGPDPDGEKKKRAERIGHHMSYQILNQMEDWDEDMDKLLLQLAIVGCAFRKTYFDAALGRNCSDLVPAKSLIFNHSVSFRKLRRISHEIPLFKNDVIERIRSGLFNEIDLPDDDEDEQIEFLEQHCWYDIDGDGYKEPYIVTVKKDSGEVVRVVARYEKEGIYLNAKGQVSKITPVGYFTKFSFMPNPDGGSYDVGLGLLLNPINETVNTTLNQLLDAATLANTGGGFVGSGLRMKGGVMRFTPGEYKQLDNSGGKIADNIYHMQFPGPSQALFQLLGLLIESGKDISSVKDILTGEQEREQTATTTLALIEQGQKVFSAIYKRVHRSLKHEFRKLYRLNKLYMQPEEYFMFQDKAEPILLGDYQGDDTDVSPVSDPDLVSDTQRLTQAEALMRFIGDPMFDQMEIRERYLTAIKEPNPGALLVNGPSPEVEELTKTVEQLDGVIQKMTKEIEGLETDRSIDRQKIQVDAKNNEGKLQIEYGKLELEQRRLENIPVSDENPTDPKEAEIAKLQSQREMDVMKAQVQQDTELKKAQLHAMTQLLIEKVKAGQDVPIPDFEIPDGSKKREQDEQNRKIEHDSMLDAIKNVQEQTVSIVSIVPMVHEMMSAILKKLDEPKIIKRDTNGRAVSINDRQITRDRSGNITTLQ